MTYDPFGNEINENDMNKTKTITINFETEDDAIEIFKRIEGRSSFEIDKIHQVSIFKIKSSDRSKLEINVASGILEFKKIKL